MWRKAALAITLALTLSTLAAAPCDDLGSEINFFVKPVSDEDWRAVLQLVRDGKVTTSDGLRFYDILVELDKLDPARRAPLLTSALSDYFNVTKDPNRRGLEVIVNRLFRADERFAASIASGRKAGEAYRDGLAAMQKFLGTPGLLAYDDLLAIARGLQGQCQEDDVIYLIGSAAGGKALADRSDVDFRYIHVSWHDRRPWSYIHVRLPYAIRRLYQEIFANRLEARVERVFDQRFPNDEFYGQVFDMTPGSIYSEGAWRTFGNQNPYILEIRRRELAVHVFAPAVASLTGGHLNLESGASQRYPID